MATNTNDEMVRTHVVLPKGLVDAMDRLVGARHRSEFIAGVVAEEVNRRRRIAAAEAFAGSLRDVDTPGWNTPEEAAAWVRASRARDDQRMPQPWGIA